MEFESPIEEDIDSGADVNPAEVEQDARDQAAADHGAEKDEAHKAELSGITNRMERFGVGPNSASGRAVAGTASKSSNTFHMAALAQSYSQPITFTVGGRGVTMGLGDIRDIASDRYNHYAGQLRTLKDQGAGQAKIKAARQRMNAYGDLMRLADDVANGKASPEEINKHIQKYNLDQEIVTAALSDPDIDVTYDAPQTAEAAQAGTHADQAMSAQTSGVFDTVFGRP